MRNRTLLCAALLTSLSQAQDWALLNPAYRYNYSNDGTDTISNQIRVMDVDTLGVDSFRYELNLIGVVCDTCPLSLGGPCNGCYVRVNQPQFLGYECIRYGEDWIFNGRDTFLVKSNANTDDSWMFNATDGITATVNEVWAEDVFDVPDTLQRIFLSDGDSICISRTFGILNFDRNDEHFDLIGVEGADVGREFPDPLEYFDFEPGDELIYKVSSQGWYQPDGNYGYPTIVSRNWRIIITSRDDVTDGVTYSTSTALGPSSGGGYVTSSPNWQLPSNQWSFFRSDVLARHPILGAYPGEVMDTSICDYDYDQRPTTLHLASHGLTADGRAIMRSKVLRYVGGHSTSGINGDNEVALDLYTFTGEDRVNVWYEEGLGVLLVEHRPGVMMRAYGVELVGAIIGGDTIIAPPEINWVVSTPDREIHGLSIFPNPASSIVVLEGLQSGRIVMIQDIEGRLIRFLVASAASEFIDVQGLAPGIYIIALEGKPPQRLMIAR